MDGINENVRFMFVRQAPVRYEQRQREIFIRRKHRVSLNSRFSNHALLPQHLRLYLVESLLDVRKASDEISPFGSMRKKPQQRTH